MFAKTKNIEDELKAIRLLVVEADRILGEDKLISRKTRTTVHNCLVRINQAALRIVSKDDTIKRELIATRKELEAVLSEMS